AHSALPPAVRISSTTLFTCVSTMSVATTLAPSAANRRLASRPRPCPAPVITTTLSSKRISYPLVKTRMPATLRRRGWTRVPHVALELPDELRARRAADLVLAVLAAGDVHDPPGDVSGGVGGEPGDDAGHVDRVEVEPRRASVLAEHRLVHAGE